MGRNLPNNKKPPQSGFFKDWFNMIMFDDLEWAVKNFVTTPANAMKSVAPRRTYDFGYGDNTHGYGLEIRNGRMIEKTVRKVIFFKKHNIVKFWRLIYHAHTNYSN